MAGDAVRRHCASRRRPFEVLTVAATGTLAVRYAAERELVREGHDRDTIPPGSFRDRVTATGERARREIGSFLTAVGVAVHLPTLSERRITDAARVAFVRLHDEGIIASAEGVVECCPRCAATVESHDVALVEQQAETFVLRFPFVDGGGGVDVRFDELELLGGVVAVAVPRGADAGEVAVPVVGRRVPVIAVAGVDEPCALVPAHDRASLDLARSLRLSSVEVLDGTGTVRGGGPLSGLGRHGARLLASDLAEAERAVAAREEATVVSRRCAHCATELIRSLVDGWFLRMGRLGAVPDAVREGDIAVRPARFRDDLVEADAGDWPVATVGSDGVAAPVARCEHCGNWAVDASDDYICRKCAGTLTGEGLVLAPRFVASIWPLASVGWPLHEPRVGDVYERTAALVASEDLQAWVRPSVGLALRLVGVPPFSQVVVQPDVPEPPPPEDPAVARIGMIGGVRWDRATDVVAALNGGAGPTIDVNALATAVRGALDDAAPADAAIAVVSALAAGLDPEQAAAVANIARPVVGR